MWPLQCFLPDVAMPIKELNSVLARLPTIRTNTMPEENWVLRLLSMPMHISSRLKLSRMQVWIWSSRMVKPFSKGISITIPRGHLPGSDLWLSVWAACIAILITDMESARNATVQEIWATVIFSSFTTRKPIPM